MPPVHLCHVCGTDLARVRAAREPHYGLMIVCCPDCGQVAVRRRHPLQELWRAFRRLDLAATVLLVNLALAIGLVAAAVGAALWLASQRSAAPLLWRDQPLMLAWTVCLLPVLIGTWLTAGLPHWRRWSAWLCYAAITCATVLAFVPLTAVARWLQMRGRGVTPESILLDVGVTTIGAITVIVVMMVVALAGIGPGLGLQWLLRTIVRGFRRWRRRRRRMEHMR